MSRSVRVGRLLGIEVNLHYSWFFIFFILAWSLATDYFPSTSPNFSTPEYLLLGFAASLALFASVLFHELSHSVVARHFRIPVHRITLFFFGGISEIPDEHITPEVEFGMSVAGPLFSLVLSAFLFFTLPLITSAHLLALLGYVARLNLMLGLFNLVPAFPLDGGRMLRALIQWKTGSLTLATTIASRSGKFFASLLIFFGLIGIFAGTGGGLWFILLGGFVYLLAEVSVEQVLVRQSLSSLSVAQLMVRKPKGAHAEDTLDHVVRTLLIHDPHDAYPVFDQNLLVGILTKRSLLQVRPELRTRVLVKEVMSTPAFVAAPKQKLHPILTRMAQHSVPLVPVYIGKRFTGILRHEDVLQYVSVNMSSGLNHNEKKS